MEKKKNSVKGEHAFLLWKTAEEDMNGIIYSFTLWLHVLEIMLFLRRTFMFLKVREMSTDLKALINLIFFNNDQCKLKYKHVFNI